MLRKSSATAGAQPGCTRSAITHNWLRVLVGADSGVSKVGYTIRKAGVVTRRMSHFVPCRMVFGIERTSKITARPAETETR
jgi:hypothetical protein